MNLGMPEMCFIFVLVLVIVGPKKLPQIGREIGKFMTMIKRTTDDFKSQITSELEQAESKANSELYSETEQKGETNSPNELDLGYSSGFVMPKSCTDERDREKDITDDNTEVRLATVAESSVVASWPHVQPQ